MPQSNILNGDVFDGFARLVSPVLGGGVFIYGAEDNRLADDWFLR